MEAKEKAVKILLIVALLVGISGISIMMAGEQRASVGSFFGPDNTNETVLKAQTKLTELGLYSGNLSGLFGWRTRNAVYDFQELNGLVRNGILDIPTQNALFSVNTEPEYLSVTYTDAGNTFLAEWTRYMLGTEGKRIELRGTLVSTEEDAIYESVSTRLALDSDGTRYSIANISPRNLDEFINKDVIVNGLMIPFENNLGLRTVLVNYIEPGEEDFPISIGYTEAGNQYVKKWVKKIYQESHSLSGLIGTLSLGEAVRYAPGGRYTELVLSTPDGSIYSVENLSSNGLDFLVGNDIMIRGAVLNNLNSLGFQTIVINYILSLEDNPGPMASPSLSN